MSTEKLLNKAIQNIYSLTPLQEGMLFHAQQERSSSYILQSTLLLKFNIEIEKLKTACKLLSDRYDSLRTAIVYEGLPKPRQVVLKERAPSFSYIEQTEGGSIQEIEAQEISRGFDLQKEPLLRFC